NVLDEEAAAHLAPGIGGTELVDEPADGNRGGAETAPGSDDGAAGRRLVEAELAGVEEPDREPVELVAKVLIDERDIVGVALPVGELPVAAAVVGDRGEDVRGRVPELVAGRLGAVPAEPPAPHLGSDPGDVGGHGAQEAVVGSLEPACLYRVVARAGQPRGGLVDAVAELARPAAG